MYYKALRPPPPRTAQHGVMLIDILCPDKRVYNFVVLTFVFTGFNSLMCYSIQDKFDFMLEITIITV